MTASSGDTGAASPGALDGVRVLDLSTSVAGAWCSRLLAGLGAQVEFVEAAAGHPLRGAAPRDASGRSALAAYVLAGKEPLHADVGDAVAAERLREALDACDVVVESAGEGALTRWGFAAAERRASRPDLIVTSVTPHGLTGGREHLPGNDLTAAMWSGWGAINGLVDAGPLRWQGYGLSYLAGVAACCGTLLALLERERSGLGQHVDVSEDEASLEVFGAAMLRGEYFQKNWGRRKAIDALQSFPVAAADGHISVTVAGNERFRDALLALDLLHLLDDPRFATPMAREANRPEFSAHIEERVRGRTRAELMDILTALRVTAGPVLEVPELLADEHLRERGYFTGGEDGIRLPGAPFKMSRTPWRSTPPGVVRSARTPEKRRGTSVAATGPRRPLEGLRVVALTHAWMGTFCTQALGLFGADVIQIEARRRPDGWRGGYEARIAPPIASVPTAKHGYNCNFLYNSVNLNKRAITLDLADPRGYAAFCRLVEGADVVVENFATRVLDQLRITYDQLRALRPDLVMLSMSGYGRTGPRKDVTANGGSIEPASGMSSLLGYPGGPPMNSGQMIPDAISGYYGFGAVLAALHHRQRTGEGQYIDLSMQEATATLVGDAIVEFQYTGRVRPRMGNRHPEHAPHGVYRAAGPERWIALAVEDEGAWARLCVLAGRGWERDERFRNRASRKANEDALDASVAAWVGEHDRDDLVRRLQSGGVIAAPALLEREVAADPVFGARGTVVPVDHPEAGTWRQVTTSIRLDRTPASVTRAAPGHGEHSREVLTGLAGVSDAEYVAMEADNVTGMGPPSG